MRLCVPTQFAVVNYLAAHTYSGKKCPIYLNERAVQELWLKGGLSFVGIQKMLLERKLKTRNNLY
jgi:hypothetical protein